MGTLRSDDSDDNENVIRAIGLKSKTRARVSHLFVQFFAVFPRLRCEKSLISCFIEDVKVMLHGKICNDDF